MSSKHPTPQPSDIVRESFYFEKPNEMYGVEHTVLLYEDGTMTCSCPNYENEKAIQCAHIQRACSEFILSYPTDHEMQERIVEKKSEARKADIGRHNVALGIFRSRNGVQNSRRERTVSERREPVIRIQSRAKLKTGQFVAREFDEVVPFVEGKNTRFGVVVSKPDELGYALVRVIAAPETYEEIARRESSAAYRYGRPGEPERMLTEARLLELMQNSMLQMDASVPEILQDVEIKMTFTPEKRLPKKPPTEPVRRKFDFDP